MTSADTPTEESTKSVALTVRTLATVTNTATAVASLGASIALGFLLPLPVYKFLVGVAAVVAVAAIGTLTYRRFVRADHAAEAETTS